MFTLLFEKIPNMVGTLILERFVACRDIRKALKFSKKHCEKMPVSMSKSCSALAEMPKYQQPASAEQLSDCVRPKGKSVCYVAYVSLSKKVDPTYERICDEKSKKFVSEKRLKRMAQLQFSRKVLMRTFH